MIFANSRYLELVHPIWHKAHFNIRWLYTSLVFVWVFGLLLNVCTMHTTKVKWFKLTILLTVFYCK